MTYKIRSPKGIKGYKLLKSISKASLCILGMVALQAPAHAVDIQIGASIQLRAVISATKGQDMNFGSVRYENSHAGQVQLGSDGSVGLSGDSYGLSLDGGGATAGDLTLNGDSLSNIEVSCDSTAQLGSDGTSTLSLDNVQFSIDSGAAYGSGTPCAGINTASVAIDLGATPSPQLFFGAAVNFTSDSIDSSSLYSTSVGAGSPVTVRVVYQ